MLTPEDIMPRRRGWKPTLTLQGHHDRPDVWRQYHHAAQAVVEVGKSWGTPRDDDAHTALTLDEREQFSVSGGRLRAHLHFYQASVAIRAGSEGAWRDINGATADELTAWVRDTATRLAGPPEHKSVPAPDLSDHPVTHGAPFQLTQNNMEAWESLWSLYDHAAMTLVRIREVLGTQHGADQDEATPRIWPHHFDAASLFVVSRDTDNNMTKTIGVGLTPPDSIDESGYWYVSPWSKEGSAPSPVPDLPYGNWRHRDNQPPMALLTLNDLMPMARTDRPPRLAAFIAAAFNASVEMLNA